MAPEAPPAQIIEAPPKPASRLDVDQVPPIEYRPIEWKDSPAATGQRKLTAACAALVDLPADGFLVLGGGNAAAGPWAAFTEGCAL